MKMLLAFNKNESKGVLIKKGIPIILKISQLINPIMNTLYTHLFIFMALSSTGEFWVQK